MGGGAGLFSITGIGFPVRVFLARTPMDGPLFVPHPNDMQVQMLARRKAMAQAVGGWGCGVQGSDD